MLHESWVMYSRISLTMKGKHCDENKSLFGLYSTMIVVSSLINRDIIQMKPILAWFSTINEFHTVIDRRQWLWKIIMYEKFDLAWHSIKVIINLSPRQTQKQKTHPACRCFQNVSSDLFSMFFWGRSPSWAKNKLRRFLYASM